MNLFLSFLPLVLLISLFVCFLAGEGRHGEKDSRSALPSSHPAARVHEHTRVGAPTSGGIQQVPGAADGGAVVTAGSFSILT